MECYCKAKGETNISNGFKCGVCLQTEAVIRDTQKEATRETKIGELCRLVEEWREGWREEYADIEATSEEKALLTFDLSGIKGE
jgi:hypothetical protein